MQALWTLLAHLWSGSRTDGDEFERRAEELRERHDRLERLAIEADVIARTEEPESRPWDER